MSRFWRPHEPLRLVFLDVEGTWVQFATILDPWQEPPFDVDVRQDANDPTMFHMGVTWPPRFRSLVQNENLLCRAWGGLRIAIRAKNAPWSTDVDVLIVDRNAPQLLHEKRRPEHAPLDIPMPIYESTTLKADQLELWQREFPFSPASYVLYDAARDFLGGHVKEADVLRCAEAVPVDEAVAVLLMAEEDRPTWETT